MPDEADEGSSDLSRTNDHNEAGSSRRYRADDSDQELEGKASADYGIDELTGIRRNDGDSDNNGISLSSNNGSKDRNTGSQGRKSPKPAIWS